MLKFSEFLDSKLNESEEDKLIKMLESAGNLKGIPGKIIKSITQYSEGGKNSKLVPYKMKAIQKDLTAAAKLVSGWVNPADRGSFRSSKAEIEADINKKNYVSVLVKVDGEWAFAAGFEEYGQGGNYNLISAYGDVKVKRTATTATTARKRRSYDYDSSDLKATELSDFIDFKESDVEIYLVTADADRVIKKQERIADRTLSKVSPERKAAVVKFLKSKSGGIIDAIEKEIDKEIEKIKGSFSNVISLAIEGKDSSVDFKDLDKIKEKLTSYNDIAYYISYIVQTGEIKELDYSSKEMKDSYSFGKFKSAIKELQEKGL